MSPMPNFLSNENQIDDATSQSTANLHSTNDLDNNIMPNHGTPTLLTTISVEQPDDESNPQSTTTDDNLSVRSEAISDDINRNPDDLLDADRSARVLTRQRSSLPKDASVDVLASKEV